jgi:hypothetical protein
MMRTFITALDWLYERLHRGFTRRQKVLAGVLGAVILANFMFRAACPPERRFFKNPGSSAGALLSQDGVLRQYGPEPIHEAQAIVDALTDMLAGSNRDWHLVLPDHLARLLSSRMPLNEACRS